MSPIKNLSTLLRLPRLGKIHLGIKITDKPSKSPYPRATDYFVVPEEIQQYVGEKPKQLEVMFPSEDTEQFAPQYLRCYSLTQGLVCWGDGERARRKVDVETGAMASHETREGGWEWHDWTCDPEACLEYRKQCRRVLNLIFLLPTVPGLGVWQIDSSSFFSIREINSTIELVRGLAGRISFIPLTLELGSVEVSPLGMKKKTIYIMHLRSDLRLADIAKYGDLPARRVLLPEPEVEEAPEDLFPPEVLAEGVAPPLAEATSKTELSPEEPREPRTDHYTIVWQSVKALLKETKPKGELVTKWFQKHFKIDVDPSLTDFSPDRPPEKFTQEAVTGFHIELLKFKAGLPGAS